MKVCIAPSAFVATGLLCLTSATALAQNATNEAWIGQTGETNTISILQQGNSNRAGADNTAHRINQDGRFNALSIDQFGWSNAAGAHTLDASAALEGLNQRGDRNSLSITQRNLSQSGFNFLGAVFQSSVSGTAALANIVAVVQNATGGDGQAGHRIGTLTQTHADGAQAANSAAVTQTGGTNGIGNTVERLLQSGFANLAEIVQSASHNSLALALQRGNHNSAHVEQGGGERNAIDTLDQNGMNNRAAISQSGNRNHTAWMFQNNDGVAIAGNRMKITIAGDDNGGDGLGGPGSFKSQLLRLGSNAFQGAFSQIGDGNDISYTVNGGDGNLAGITQDGDGNGAIVAIGHIPGTGAAGGAGNEIGIVQTGDGNNLSLNIVGSGNIDAIAVNGDKNMLRLRQNGSGNIFDIALTGHNNNNSAFPSVGSFDGRLVAIAANADLSPGSGLQEGTGNSVRLDLAGNSNLFAFKQDGHDNAALVVVNGIANHAAVDQSGNSGRVQIKQSGTSNSMGVVQF